MIENCKASSIWKQSNVWETRDENGNTINYPIREQRCILEAMMEEEAKKPIHLRKNVFHISCPCPKCRPYFL